MSLRYINKTYGTSYKRGEKIVFIDKIVTVIGSRQQYLICRDALGVRFWAHPTWGIKNLKEHPKDE